MLRTFVLRTSALFVVSFCGVLAEAQQAVTPQNLDVNTPAASTASPSTTELPIGSGDLIEVSVYGAPDFDKKEMRVSGTGTIELPLIGQVKVAGLTTAQAEAIVRDRLKEGKFFRDPQVSIFTKEYATQGISILGEVQKPGVYPLLGPRRLFDAISMAGGLTPKAGKVVTITRRNDVEHPQRIILQDAWEASTEGNASVQPGDTIIISKAGIIYVVGDVKLPGGFLMESGKMSVLQAVAMAQGAAPTAKLDAAKLIRTQASGEKSEIPVSLKQILTSQAPDMPMQPNDILFVPNSVGKSVARRSLEAIVQATTGMAIYSRF